MQYVYAAMLLHSGQKEINEHNVEAILKSAQYEIDTARVKAMVAAIKDINIDDAIAKAAVAQVSAGPATTTEAKVEEEKDDKKSEEEAAAGLGALFG